MATFADLFRFTLLLERGGIWCDADIVCLKPLLFAREMAMFFSSEMARESDASGGVHFVPVANNGAIKVPPGHRLMEICIENHERAVSRNMRWRDAGPGALRAAVKDLDLAQYILHPDIICPVHHWEVTSLLFGARTVTPAAHAVHFWNEILRWNFFDKDETYDRHSLYERLARRYLKNDADR